jgi:hypothetical protein
MQIIFFRVSCCIVLICYFCRLGEYQVDHSVQGIIHPVSLDGKPMGQLVEVGDILSFVNDSPILKVCMH